MYADVAFHFLAEEDDNSVYYSSFYVFQSFSSDELLHLIKRKFIDQSRNLIKFLSHRKQFLEYEQRLESLGMIPTSVPIELVCDCYVHLHVFETFKRKSFEEILAWIPVEVFEIRNKIVLMDALKYRGILMLASDELKSDSEIVLKAIELDGTLKKGSFKFASKSLRSDPNFLLDAIEIDADILKYADSSLINDPEFMRRVTRKHLYCFRYIGEALQNDEEFITSVMIENSLAIVCLGELSRAIFQDIAVGDGLTQLFETFIDMTRSDLIEHIKGISHEKDQMKQLLKCDGTLLEYCSEELKNDKDVVLTAIKNNGSSLKFASTQYKSNREIVGLACRDSGENFKYSSDSLRSDFDFILEYLKRGIDLVPYHTAGIDEMLKLIGFYCLEDFIQFSAEYFPDLGTDIDLIEKIVDRCWKVRNEFSEWTILSHVSEHVIGALKKKTLVKAILLDESNFEKLPLEIQQKMEILAAYITNQVNQGIFSEYQTLPLNIQHDEEFTMMLIEHDVDYHILDHLPDDIKHSNHIIEAFVKKDMNALECCSSIYLQDIEFIKRVNAKSIQLCDEEFQLKHLDTLAQVLKEDSIIFTTLSSQVQKELVNQYKANVLEALSNNCEVYRELCEELREDHDIILTCVGSAFGSHLSEHIPDNVLFDRDFLVKLVKQNGLVYQGLHGIFDEDDDELSIEALKAWGWFDPTMLYQLRDATKLVKIFKELLKIRLQSFYTEDFYIPSKYSSLGFKC